MKRIRGTIILILFLSGALSVLSPAFCGNVLTYRDDRGRLVLVDSPAEIPARYRNRVDVLPSGKAAEILNGKLTKMLLNGCSARDINRYFLKYLFLNWQTLVLLSIFLLMLFLPFLFKNAISSMNAFVVMLFLLILFHLFVFVPNLQKRASRFSGLVRHTKGISFPVEAGIRHKVLSLRIHSETLPLVPLNLYMEVLELDKLQNSIRIQK